MKKNKGLAVIVSLAMAAGCVPYDSIYAQAAYSTNNVIVNIDTGKENVKISPYIYGANFDCSTGEDELKKVVTSSRMGGNRLTAYNWENNASNAGSDWLHSSDNYLNFNEPLDQQDVPANVMTNFNIRTKANNTKYTLGTVQIAGYVAKTKDGSISEADAAPSSKFAEVKAEKGAPLSLTPDVTDNYVYTDEYINYLVNKIGTADTTGINGYCLDNEPALWSGTHPRIHSEAAKCKEVVDKGIAAAKAIKKVDSSAEVFGPELYGMCAYVNLQDAKDWNSVKGNSEWFVDYYLKEMKKASDDAGKRLLDVFDIHYYTEAIGGGVRVNSSNVDTTNIEANKARLQSTRSLWDPSYKEDSWIGQWMGNYLPIIPKIQKSINQSYPGTKFGITEYNFGGVNHVTGGITQADALGIFGEQGVYLATYWPWGGNESYITSAFNLYRNYDGKNSTYGDTKVKAETSDVENVTVYSSIDSEDPDKLHVILLNKNYDNSENITFKIAGNKEYTDGKVYAFDENSSDITEREAIKDIDDNTFEYTIPKLTACHIVLDAEDGEVIEKPEENEMKDFVTTDGNKFQINGEDFYFAGTNNYYLPYAPHYMVDDVFRQAEAMGLKVMRTWGFIDGEKSCDLALQPEMGVYDEPSFENFDYAVAKAKEAGIRLVIPFINNWTEFGGMEQYLRWTGMTADEAKNNHDQFYTNEQCKTAYKNYINHFLNRTNSITGVKYKDDPTIMTWELTNEARCTSDTTGDTLYNWTKEMSEYIKSIDSKHLVALGDEGFFNRDGNKYNWDYNYCGGTGVDWERIMTIPSIDYGTFHLYPDGWGKTVDWANQWIKDHLEVADSVNKPAVLEEFGIKSDRDNVYKTWTDMMLNGGGDGSMFWILAGVGFDGKEEYPDYDGFTVRYPSTTATVLSKHAADMTAKSGSNSESSDVEEVILGDVNSDGKINIKDYVKLQKYLLNNDIAINSGNADMNKDGKINVTDCLLLKKMLLDM